AEQGARAVQARGVHDHQLGVGAVHDAAHHVPGGLRPVGGDRDLLADQRVGQRGLAGVRPAHEAHESGAEPCGAAVVVGVDSHAHAPWSPGAAAPWSVSRPASPAARSVSGLGTAGPVRSSPVVSTVSGSAAGTGGRARTVVMRTRPRASGPPSAVSSTPSTVTVAPGSG